MADSCIYLDTYVVQQDMRIRLSGQYRIPIVLQENILELQLDLPL